MDPALAQAAAALGIISTVVAGRFAPALCRLRFVREPEAGQCDAGEADTELLQRRAARYGLSHAPGEFIELVAHIMPSVGYYFLFAKNPLRNAEDYK
jgi:hypothetical protein